MALPPPPAPPAPFAATVKPGAPNNRLPSMATSLAPPSGSAADAAAPPGKPRPPSPKPSTRRRSPRPYHGSSSRPQSAPLARPPPGNGAAAGGNEPAAAATAGPARPASRVAQRADPPRRGRPVSAPQFRRGRSVTPAPPESRDLKTPVDGMNRPTTPTAPKKTPPAPRQAPTPVPQEPMPVAAEVSLPLGPSDAEGAAREPASADGDISPMWEPSPRTMDELDAEVMGVTGAPPVSGKARPASAPGGRPSTVEPSEQPDRPATAQAGRFTERPSSSRGFCEMSAVSGVTPRRLAALQKEVKHMKRERINPTPTKVKKQVAEYERATAQPADAAPETKPAASGRKKRPRRPPTKRKSAEPAQKLSVQVPSPNGEPRQPKAAGIERSASDPDTPVMTPSPLDAVCRTPPSQQKAAETVSDLWESEDACQQAAGAAATVVAASNGGSGMIVAVEEPGSDGAIEQLMAQVDSLTARLTTSEQEKALLSAKINLLHKRAKTAAADEEEEDQEETKLLELEIERQHLEETTGNLQNLMDTVESSWREKYCQLAAQNLFRGDALQKVQVDQSAAIADAGRAEQEARTRQWREKAELAEADLAKAVGREASVMKQMAGVVSSLEKLQEENEFVGAARAQAEAALEQERSKSEARVAELTAALAAERELTRQLRSTQAASQHEAAETQRGADARVSALQGELEEARGRAASLERTMSQKEQGLAQLEESQATLREQQASERRQAEADSDALSAALARIMELEAELRQLREQTAPGGGHAETAEQLRHENAELRARLTASEVGAQEVAQEHSLEAAQLRTALSAARAELAAAKDSTTLTTHSAGAKAEDVKLALSLSSQTAQECAAHSLELVELHATVEGLREMVDNGTDSAAELQEHVATLQQLVVAQRRAPARTGSSGAAEDSAQLNRVFSDPATEVGTPAAAGSGQAKPERKRHGSAGKGTRQKQESMRNALRQLRRELHKVQAQPAVAARLEKENAASPELGAALASALSTKSSGAVSAKPAKLSTVAPPSSSLLGVR